MIRARKPCASGAHSTRPVDLLVGQKLAAGLALAGVTLAEETLVGVGEVDLGAVGDRSQNYRIGWGTRSVLDPEGDQITLS